MNMLLKKYTYPSCAFMVWYIYADCLSATVCYRARPELQEIQIMRKMQISESSSTRMTSKTIHIISVTLQMLPALQQLSTFRESAQSFALALEQEPEPVHSSTILS